MVCYVVLSFECDIINVSGWFLSEIVCDVVWLACVCGVVCVCACLCLSVCLV